MACPRPLPPSDDLGPVIGRDSQSDAKWAPPCPYGNPQRVRAPRGFWEPNIGELELRVGLHPDEQGVCQVIVDETPDEIYVRVLVCYEGARRSPIQERLCRWPVRVRLAEPLSGRAVIDVDGDEELPLYIPKYLGTLIQPDHGYHPAERRRKRA
jgi:hypothetical protein